MLFTHRSYQKELLDHTDIPFEDIKRNMQELDVINTYLGGHQITICGIKKLLRNNNEKILVAEIGCGGGDNLRQVGKWFSKRKIDVELIGVDINPECILFAKSQETNAGIQFIHSDYRHVSFDRKPHIIFSSLFCHHFSEQDLVSMLQWKKSNSVYGFFINDLHRHALAYCSIKVLTSAFSKSYLVKNDAPLSVQRGFIKKDWEPVFSAAGIKHYNIEWKWAFRWLITYMHQ